jgi:mRNA interferase HigB
MVIIARPILREFIFRYPLSSSVLNDWYAKTKKSNWAKFSDVKAVFNTVDAIGNDRYVFDIGGNKFRLIAMIHFKSRTIFIRKILTHDEYNVLSKQNKMQNL